MISFILSSWKWFISSLTVIINLSKYIRNYRGIKKSDPRTFTIATKTKYGSTTYTTGRVIKINLWKVIIEGYQVEDIISNNGIFTIKLYSIHGVCYHQDTHSYVATKNNMTNHT